MYYDGSQEEICTMIEGTQEEICTMRVHRKKYVLRECSLKVHFDDLKMYIIIF